MLKRTVSLRRFFWVLTTHVLVEKYENNILVRTLNTRPGISVNRLFGNQYRPRRDEMPHKEAFHQALTVYKRTVSKSEAVADYIENC